MGVGAVGAVSALLGGFRLYLGGGSGEWCLEYLRLPVQKKILVLLQIET